MIIDNKIISFHMQSLVMIQFIDRSDRAHPLHILLSIFSTDSLNFGKNCIQLIYLNIQLVNFLFKYLWKDNDDDFIAFHFYSIKLNFTLLLTQSHEFVH